MDLEAVARVIMIDDEALVLDAVCSLLAMYDDIRIIGRGGSIADLEVMLGDRVPDIVIVDHDLPDGDVGDVIDRVHRRCPTTRVVVLTNALTAQRVASSIRAGVAGYLLRTQGSDAVAAALRLVRSGGCVLAAEASALLASGTEDAVRQPLSRRERDVLQSLVVTGSRRKTADELALQPTTVRNHIQRAMTKLGAHSTMEAVMLAIRERIIDVPDGPTGRV